MNPVLCGLCDAQISDSNDSGEHIIPQSISGRKVVRGFLCRKCNNERGRKWEKALAEQFKQISVFLNIRRQKKLEAVPVDTVDGTQLLLSPDGSTAILESKLQPLSRRDTIEIQQVPPHLLKGQIRGLKRRHSVKDIHIESGFSLQDHVYSLRLHIGDEETHRSTMKSAMAMAVYAGIDASECNIAQRFLRDSKEPCDSCLGLFYSDEHDILMERPVPILHCVAVGGDPLTHKLIGYVEYFSTFRWVAVLSDGYLGEAFSKSYAIDPVRGVELKVDVDLGFAMQEIEAILGHRFIDHGVRESAGNRLAAIAVETRRRKEDEFVAKEIVRIAAAKVIEIDSESVERFTEEVSHKCKEFLRHNYERFSIFPDDLEEFRRHLNCATRTQLRTFSERTRMR